MLRMSLLHGLGSSSQEMQNYFGDGSDGVLNTAADVTLDSIANGDVVVKQYESITVNTGHTLTVSNPCGGLVLYSKGDVVIDGTISMSKKAGLNPFNNGFLLEYNKDLTFGIKLGAGNVEAPIGAFNTEINFDRVYNPAQDKFIGISGKKIYEGNNFKDFSQVVDMSNIYKIEDIAYQGGKFYILYQNSGNDFNNYTNTISLGLRCYNNDYSMSYDRTFNLPAREQYEESGFEIRLAVDTTNANNIYIYYCLQVFIDNSHDAHKLYRFSSVDGGINWSGKTLVDTSTNTVSSINLINAKCVNNNSYCFYLDYYFHEGDLKTYVYLRAAYGTSNKAIISNNEDFDDDRTEYDVTVVNNKVYLSAYRKTGYIYVYKFNTDASLTLENSMNFASGNDKNMFTYDATNNKMYILTKNGTSGNTVCYPYNLSTNTVDTANAISYINQPSVYLSATKQCPIMYNLISPIIFTSTKVFGGYESLIYNTGATIGNVGSKIKYGFQSLANEFSILGGNGGNGGNSGSYGGDYASGGSGGSGRKFAGGIGGGGGGGSISSSGYTGSDGASITNPYMSGRLRGGERITNIYLGRDLNSHSFVGGGAAGEPNSTSPEYAGGFICIIAQGNVTISSTGKLECNGGQGGNGSSNAVAPGSGGGAGGGVVIIWYNNMLNNSGTIEVNGGIGGTIGSGYSPTRGASGTVGTILVEKI